MSYLALLLRLALALTFLLASVSKVVSWPAAVRSAEAFGIPRAGARAVTAGLCGAEFAVGLALVPSSTARWSAGVAAALLVVFTVAIIGVIRNGRSVACNCFGALSSRPVGSTHVLRNVTLFAASVLVASASALPVGALGDPPGSYSTADSTLAVLLAALAVIVAGLMVALALMMRQQARVLRRLHALEGTVNPVPAGIGEVAGRRPGSVAPRFSRLTLDGDSVSLDDLLARRRPVTLVFIDPGCGPCQALAPEVADWQRSLHDKVTVVVISAGDDRGVRQMSQENGLHDVLIDSGDLAAVYGSPGTPSAVLISERGRLMSPPVTGADAIRFLIERSATSGVPPEPVTSARAGHGDGLALAVGSIAPMIPGAPSLQAGHEARLVLFWDGRCRYSQQLTPALEAYCSAGNGLLDLVIVDVTADGEGWHTAVDGAAGQRCLIVPDREHEIASSYGARGTPIGIVVDKDNAVLSPLMAGGEMIRSVLSVQPGPA